jgi:YHS domain-containing protein
MKAGARLLGYLVLTMILAAGVSALLIGCQKDKPTAGAPQTSTAQPAPAAEAAQTGMQTTCPVMEGNPINKAIFVEYKGQKVYFCCKGCPEQFLTNPEKYISKLPQFAQ